MVRAQETPSANDRLKEHADDIVAYALILAAGLHFLAFQLWPEMTSPDWSSLAGGDEIVVIEMPETPLPVAPEPLRRPARPVIDPAADATATIEPFDPDRASELLLPPPPPAETTVGDRDPFVVYEVLPRLVNPDDLRRALERAYPAPLRDSGIGGRVTLQVYVGVDGEALDARVTEGSGYERLDRAALGLVSVMRFSPALNRDRPVAVWVQMPIDFQAR